MQRRNLIRGLIALAIGGTVGKFAKGRELATGGFYKHTIENYGLPEIVTHIYGRAGVGPEHLDLTALRPQPPQNVALADRRGHDDGYVIQWTTGKVDMIGLPRETQTQLKRRLAQRLTSG